MGTPQGGIISPLLANIVLDGIEREIGVRYPKRKSSNLTAKKYRLVLDDYIPKKQSNFDKGHLFYYGPLLNRINEIQNEHKFVSKPISFIRYADDFVVLSETKEDAYLIKSKLKTILALRGLELSEEKTNL